jgi:hypothetical protein
MTDKKDVATVDLTPMQLLSQVVENPDFDVAKLEKMLDLQERWEDRKAIKDFNKAVAQFQADVPGIHKGRTGAHNIKYAPLDDILKTIQPLLTDQGLSVRFSTEMIDKSTLKATCTISHVSGHSEASEITIPIDDKMVANSSQKMGSANSYAKRYALANALNLAFMESDDDATGLYERLSVDQATVINDLLKETGANKEKFLGWAGGVDAVEDIAAKNFNQCQQSLESKRGTS